MWFLIKHKSGCVQYWGKVQKLFFEVSDITFDVLLKFLLHLEDKKLWWIQILKREEARK